MTTTSTPPGHPTISLAERQQDLTRTLIVDAALQLLEQQGLTELTNRTIAQAAAISERTVYRHFATRDALLDALAAGYAQRIGLPQVPGTLDELIDYPRRLYPCYEAHAALTRAALHPDLFHRIRATHARERWDAIRDLIAEHTPQLSTRQREWTAANIRYFLAATAWNYYRSYFGFSLDDSVEAVVDALRRLLAAC